jgi:hypothetical protein
VLRGETGLEARLERVRETFGTESVALLEGESDVAPWTCAGRVGLERELERPEDADVDVPIGDHVALALTGRVGGDRGLFCRGGRQGDFHTCLWAAVDGHGPARWPAGTTWLYICWGFAVVLLGALLKVVNDYREAALAQVQLREVGSQLR